MPAAPEYARVVKIADRGHRVGRAARRRAIRQADRVRFDAPDTWSPLVKDDVAFAKAAAQNGAAACLSRERVPFVILEQSHQIGSAWRNHYQRLHLHTSKGLSGLPYFPFAPDVPRYPSREQVIAYLEAYAAHFALTPRFGERVV